ncbi:outer membrane protein transport protein [Myxococcota bacterium]|nr:outer membrane protein transport protein [Myxococcota bacterium]
MSFHGGLKRLGTFAACAVVVAAAGEARGAGFEVTTHGANGMSRANAVVATVKDASAVYYNVAGLTQVQGTEVQLGVTAIAPRGEYRGVGITGEVLPGSEVTQEADTPIVPVPNLYAAHALSSRAFVGLGFYAPYGLGVQWNAEDDQGKFVGRTAVQQISLRTYFITPSVALKLSDEISLGVGVSLVPATIYLKRTLGASNGQVLFPAASVEDEGQIELAGSAFGVGATFGVQARLIDHLRIGLQYRSAVELSFTGDADFQLPANTPAEIAATFPDGPVDASATLPHSFNLGIGWEQGPLTAEIGLQYSLWSSYDELRINFGRGLPAPSSASPRNWENVPLFKAGAQYSFTDEIAGRIGFGYDMSPAPDNTVEVGLPDADRLFFTIGAGYDFGMFNADLGYMGLKTADRTVTESISFAPGEYKGGFIHLLALTLGVNI